MKKILILAAGCVLLFACNNEKKDESKTEGTSTTKTDGKKPAAELLDMSAGDQVKASSQSFSKGDIDGMTANFDDNILYMWSGGDSIRGKQAVKDYWTGRWKIIESLNFSNDIILPVQLNESQAPQYAPPGKWVLHWFMVDVTYKNGKKLNFWNHTVNHYNEAGKVDYVAVYQDRHPIIEATKDLVQK